MLSNKTEPEGQVTLRLGANRGNIQAKGIFIFARLFFKRRGQDIIQPSFKASAWQFITALHFRHNPSRCGANHTKTDVVVEVIGFVPVAVRTARVVSIIVPGATAHHAGLLLNEPFTHNVPNLWTAQQCCINAAFGTVHNIS